MQFEKTELVIPAEYIDCYQHVHYSDYLKIFENARSAFFERRGIHLGNWQELAGIRAVTRHIEIEYIRELREGDRIDINTAIMRVGETSFTFYHALVREGETVATCKQVFVMTNSAREKMALPYDFRAKLLA